MTAKQILLSMGRSERVEAMVYAIHRLLLQRGVYGHGEFNGLILEWSERDCPALGLDLIHMVAAQVCARYGVAPEELLRSREARVAFPRQVAMYLVRRLSNYSLPGIGARFGKHHTTVLHGIRRVEAARTADAALNSFLDSVVAHLPRNGNVNPGTPPAQRISPRAQRLIVRKVSAA